MATVFTLNAASCPVPVVPAALLSIAGAAPNVAQAIVAGNTGVGSLSTPFNMNAVSLDALGRAGAGAYAVDWDSNPASAVLPGFDLTVDAGLDLAIAAGQAVLDGVVQQLAPVIVTLTDNIARTYLWIGQGGVISQVMNSLTPPSGVQAFIGSVVTDTGAITEIDGSGVMYFKAGHLWRRTSDTSAPTDSPPAGLSFFNECPGGLFWWSGVTYHNLTNSGRIDLDFSSDADKTLSAAEANNRDLSFTATGTALGATRDVILPLLPAGRHWTLTNNSPGAQSLRAIGTSGAGVTIATTKYAEIRSSGTDILRVTPDT